MKREDVSEMSTSNEVKSPNKSRKLTNKESVDSSDSSSDWECARMDRPQKRRARKTDYNNYLADEPSLNVENLYNKICSKIYRSTRSEPIMMVERFGSVEYGNIVPTYDPASSLSTFKRENDDEMDSDSQYLPIELFKLLNGRINKINIRNLNIIRKSSLLSLIERNRLNSIYCPFDELAHARLVNPGANVYKINGNEAELARVPLMLFEVCKINTYSLMPNCCSTLLMPFFFDIFKPSEIKQYSSKTVDILLKLKSAFTPQLYLDEKLLASFCVENLLWNCFSLFRFKFNANYRTGFLNYLLSLTCLMSHFKAAIATCDEQTSQSNRLRYLKLKKAIVSFVEALVLNGFLNNNDLYQIQSTLDKFPNLKLYQDELFAVLGDILAAHTPMKLKNLCRIAVKNRMSDFTNEAVNKLLKSENDKKFFYFDLEFERSFEENFSQL